MNSSHPSLSSQSLKCHVCNAEGKRMEYTTFAYWWCPSCRTEIEDTAPPTTGSIWDGGYIFDWSKIPNVVTFTPSPAPTSAAPLSAAKTPGVFKPGDRVLDIFGTPTTVEFVDHTGEVICRNPAYPQSLRYQPKDLTHAD